MTRKVPYLTEAGLGLLISAMVAWGHHSRSAFVESVSLKTYDLFSKFRKQSINTNDIALVEIDENAVANLGRWPWPRALVAQLVDEIAHAEAKIIGLDILFVDTDQNQGLEEIAQLQKSFAALKAAEYPVLKKKRVSLASLENFESDLETAKSNLDGDNILARSIEEASNVVLPMYFQSGDPLGNNLEPLPSYFEAEKIKNSNGLPDNAPSGISATTPLENFGKVVLGVGHVNIEVSKDVDGTVRRMAPLMKYCGGLYPSFGLQVVREYWNYQRDSLSGKKGESLSLGNAKIPLDEEAKTFLGFVGSESFKRYSALDVLSGGIPDKALAKKIVLVGVTAPGL